MFIAEANATSTSVLENSMSLWDFILLAISLFVLIAWVLSIIFILWWWLLLVLSWWKDDKIKPAINTIRYAVIWIVVTVVTIFAFPILWALLWLDVDQYAKPKRIFEKIEEIWAKVFWWWTSTTTNSDLWDFPNDFSEL